jgi:hypothetical protein
MILFGYNSQKNLAQSNSYKQHLLNQTLSKVISYQINQKKPLIKQLDLPQLCGPKCRERLELCFFQLPLTYLIIKKQFLRSYHIYNLLHESKTANLLLSANLS